MPRHQLTLIEEAKHTLTTHWLLLGVDGILRFAPLTRTQVAPLTIHGALTILFTLPPLLQCNKKFNLLMGGTYSYVQWFWCTTDVQVAIYLTLVYIHCVHTVHSHPSP